ncbi:TPA: polyprenyl synthetase family protein [Candidatus Poribacteria bacterium]|nr:polyprenyl synthetase family protein [Candidatus Poribacteria bacterium]
MKYKLLFDELDKRKRMVYDYLFARRYSSRFQTKHIHDSVYSYMKLGGKSLRPAVLLFSCGVVGGDEEKAIPAAAAVEVFHTWTLVHDDIIDRDKTRRGGLAVHEEFRQRAIEEFGYDPLEAKHYGISIAMLAGDMQQGWAVSMLTELATQRGIRPEVALYLINDSEMRVLGALIDGEVRDIQFSRQPIDSLDEELILDMLWKKTGALYEFSGKAGAMIGLNTDDPEHELVAAILNFAGKCGIAFQLQDDILGIVGDEETLGKPVGSDIREGKRTTIVYHSFKNSNPLQREFLLSVLGNAQAKKADVQKSTEMLIDLGGIEYTAKLAKSYIQEAIVYLDKLPDSKYKQFLAMWADYMIERTF